ncbi:MAG: DUF2779 domain-containing protein [Candidatus Saccharimonas aalborgensis]
MSEVSITKSDYMLSRVHPAWLWLKKHQPERLPPLTAQQQQRFDAGSAFEPLVEQRFAGAVDLGFSNWSSYRTLTERTREALDGGARTIFQGRFEHGPFTFICDIVDVVDQNVVDLYEIKSSTRVKPEHLYDLAFQLFVLEGAGYEARNISVIHVNPSFVRHGDIDPLELSSVTDVTEKVRALEVSTATAAAHALATVLRPTMPDPSPSLASRQGLRGWLEIHQTLWPSGEDSIYSSVLISPALLATCEELGISKLADIPPHLVERPALVAHIEAAKAGGINIDKQKIREWLSTLEYPLYFLDYETAAGVVPPYDGVKPYEQVPFQYSLHVLDSPDSEVRHTMYLHEMADMPAGQLVPHLLSSIGNKGSIVAWSMGFEQRCNETMARLVPEYSADLLALNERMRDPIELFYKGYYADIQLGGSASIKKVLPALVPELSYRNMAIADGAVAQKRWMEAVLSSSMDECERRVVFDELREYCALDTLAMVEIFRKLCEVSQ